MKIFFTLFFLLFISGTAFSATCTTISRSNYSANTVLGSSALNTDFNTVYNAYNAIDGGCITDGTVEFSALNSSDFSATTNGIHQGCALAYSDTNTISVGKCIATVNGFNIKTTVANTVTWNCSGCSAEAASTVYYIYIKTGSSGTTLNLLISTTAPGVDGYDSSSNKVIGRFFNNASSNIDSTRIDNWTSNRFSSIGVNPVTPGASNQVEVFSFNFGTTDATTACSATPCSYLDQIGNAVTSVTRGSAGAYTLNTVKTYVKLRCAPLLTSWGAQNRISTGVSCDNCAGGAFFTYNTSISAADAYGGMNCIGSF